MKKIILALLCVMSINAVADDHTMWVNPFIGTEADETGSLAGSTFPGACVPQGMVQVSPETELYVTWDPCSGYDYQKDRIYGITHTHLSGTGCTDLIDISLMPTTADITPEYIAKGDFSQRFSHEQEGAWPGYYWVKLLDSDVTVELSATTHGAFHQYGFPAGAPQQLILDLDHSTYRGDDAYYIQKRGYNILQSQIRIIDDHTIEGYRVITGWAKLRKVYFHAEFSKPFTSTLLMDGQRNMHQAKVINGRRLRAALTFNNSGNNPVIAKVAISAVDQEGANRNFKAEMGAWQLADYTRAAHDRWEKELSTIDIDGTDEEKTIFYTGLYHALIQPNIISDVDGRYIDTNYQVKRMPRGKHYYSTFSLWDTFRAAHPLYNLFYPTLTADLIEAMVLHHKTYGYLPIWDLWGQENYCMIGNHAIPVLSQAIMSDLPGINAEECYKAMIESSTTSHYNSPFEIWEQYGYMPETLQSQSVSITLEQAFDDWCVAACAKKLGKQADYEHFLKRSEFYRNLFNPAIGFFAPKDEKGQWMPFDPLGYGGNGGNPFTEGNAWQYLWFVPQNPQGLIELFGGKEGFMKKLDENFTLEDKSGETNGNASGFIGQYAHGNEPSHHTVYLYNFAGRPERTQELVNEVRNKFYNSTPMGYAGNDDCGQMSSWYIFSSLGFYPFNAGSGEFVLGTPLFPQAQLHLQNGVELKITARNLLDKKGKKRIHVKQVKLNGKPVTTLTQQQLMQGGELEFIMK